MITAAAPVDDTAPTGTVFAIQRFSTDDGPGIRTTVFLKGCPLRCKACCNPEGLRPEPELMLRATQCIGTEACGACLTRCPVGAITPETGGKVRVDFARCTGCGDCVSACPSKALQMVGRTMTVVQVLDEVERDAAFYRHSGGGLTLSGGEVLRQSRFAAALLKEARARGMATAIETSGMASWNALARLLPHLDLVHYDIKNLDSAEHRRFTGHGNEIIRRNLVRLCQAFPPSRVRVRTPYVPGVNARPEVVRAIREWLVSISPELHHELMPWHGFGDAKYVALGLPNPMYVLGPAPTAEVARHRALTRLPAERRRARAEQAR